MSDRPRTDALFDRCKNKSNIECMAELEELCRTIEGELSEVTKQRDALAEALERLKKLPEKWRNECSGNWLRGGVVLQLADDFEAATKGGDV
jgi:molybdopterin converting factor small subunit